MKAKLLIPVLTLAAAAAPIQAQTCNENVAAVAPDSRYIDNGDGTVTDTRTWLIWKQCPEGLSGPGCTEGKSGRLTWLQALRNVSAVNADGGFAGHTDWRLPSHKELASLVETKCDSPAINTNLFPNTPGSDFWSATPYANLGDSAWYISFSDGDDGSDEKEYEYRVRLVRGDS